MAKKNKRKDPKSKPGSKVKRSMGQLISGHNAMADILFNARHAMKQREFGKSIALYEKALNSAANVKVSMVCEALAPLTESQSLAEAVKFLSQWIDKLPPSAQLHAVRGQVYLGLRRVEDAKTDYQRAISIQADDPYTHAQVANVLERLHQLDEALDSIDRARSLDPGNFIYAAPQSIILGRLKRYDEAKKILIEATQAAMPPVNKFLAWIHLAGVYDKTGDYDQAFSAYEQAREALGSEADKHWELARLQGAQFDQALARLTKDRVHRWRDSFTQRPLVNDLPQPMCFFVGHPRSGTTLVEQIMAAHSKVLTLDETTALSALSDSISRQRDYAPLSDTLDSMKPHDCEKAAYFYMQEAAKQTDQPFAKMSILDKHPSNLTALPTVMRIFPTSRVLMALRDPRDVLVSCMLQAFEPTAVSVQFRNVETAMQHGAKTWGAWLQMREVIAQPWHEIRYENLVDSFEDEARKLVDFMGLPWEDGLLDFHKKAAKRYVSTPSYAGVGTPVNKKSVARWRNYEPFLKPHLHIIEPVLEQLGYTA